MTAPKLRHAVYGGSFDPPTLGHLNLIQRAAQLCDTLTIGIGINPHKRCLFELPERIEMLQDALQQQPQVEVCAYENLLVDFCRERKAQAIIRGLRAVADFEYEFQIALANRDLAPEIETIFLIAATDKLFLSSSVVKEIASHGRDVSAYVTPLVAHKLKEKLRS